MTRTDDGCADGGWADGAGHAGLPAELRAVVLLALERITPMLDRAAAGPATGPASCASCPVCAVLAVLRGERPELGVRLAEQASGLLAVLRAALEEPEPAARPAPQARVVQHIRVERVRVAG